MSSIFDPQPAHQSPAHACEVGQQLLLCHIRIGPHPCFFLRIVSFLVFFGHDVFAGIGVVLFVCRLWTRIRKCAIFSRRTTRSSPMSVTGRKPSGYRERILEPTAARAAVVHPREGPQALLLLLRRVARSAVHPVPRGKFILCCCKRLALPSLSFVGVSALRSPQLALAAGKWLPLLRKSRYKIANRCRWRTRKCKG